MRPGQLAAPLQLAPPTQWNRRLASHVQTQIVKKPTLDSSQLGVRMRESPDGGCNEFRILYSEHFRQPQG